MLPRCEAPPLWETPRAATGALIDRKYRSGGVGGELRGVHGLDGRRADAEDPRHVRAQAVLEGVLAGGQPLEEEVRPAVANLFVPADPEVPAVTGDRALRLAPGGPRVAQVHVLRLVFGRERDLDLDLVARRDRHPFRERLQDEARGRGFPLEVFPRDREEVAPVLQRELLGREVPRRRREREPLALLLDDDRGRRLRVELAARDDYLVLFTGVAVGLENE